MRIQRTEEGLILFFHLQEVRAVRVPPPTHTHSAYHTLSPETPPNILNTWNRLLKDSSQQSASKILFWARGFLSSSQTQERALVNDSY